MIVSCSNDKTSYLWDVSTGESVRKLRGHSARINSLSLNKEFTIMATASYDATVMLWDLKSNAYAPIQTLNEAKDSVTSVEIRGGEIVAGSVDGRVRVYDLRAGRMRTDFIGEPVTSARLSNDSNCLLVSSLDDTVRYGVVECDGLLKPFAAC